MDITPRTFRFLLLLAFLFAATGCARTPHPDQSALPAEATTSVPGTEQTKRPVDAEATEKSENLQGKCPDQRTILNSERNRASCFHLQPGVTVTKKVKTTGKKGQKTTSKTTTKKGQKTTTKTIVKRTTGRCQPQSLIYARCRTGIMTCRLGDTSPVQWFACAKKNGDATSTPTAGSVMVLAVNTGRGMPTGHPMYVEAVKENQDGTWTLRITHTNYDRKCHLDQDATVLYHPRQMSANFQSGPWATWAKDLKALGFILR